MPPTAAARRLAPIGALVVLLAGASAAVPEPARAAEGEVSLEGTWYVLVHYRDSMTANPDADRWEDKVWKFEKKGSRLQWTEFPLVVFNDRSGRFGRVGRNPRARLLHKWEPNEDQLAELEIGPQVNSRGSKTKSLRGSPKRGYQSGTASRSMSAMTVGYEETWSIDDPTGMPVFTRDDALGTEMELATGGEEVLSGRTRYATLQVLDGGATLTGRYTRDENEQGTFRMFRTGDARGIESDGRTPDEKAQERQIEAARSLTRDVAYREFLQSLGDERVRSLRAQLGEDGLNAVWQRYEKRIIGGDPSARRELAGALREAYVAALLDDAVTSIRDWEGDPVARARQEGAPAREVALLESVRDTVGEDRIAALRRQYGEGLAAGDEGARAAVRDAVREAYTSALEAELRERLEAGDSEALRELRERQRQ